MWKSGERLLTYTLEDINNNNITRDIQTAQLSSYYLQFSVKVLSYQKIPETAYKLSEDLENGNRKIMQKEEGYNRKEKYENVMKMMMTTTTNGDDNDDDNDDRCLQCVTVSECKQNSLQAVWS